MASGSKKTDNAAEIDRLAMALAKEPGSKVFIPLAEEYGKAGRWEDAVAVLEDGLKTYPGFITAMVALGRAYEQVNQVVGNDGDDHLARIRPGVTECAEPVGAALSLSPPGMNRSAVTRLEQWLHLIQARRRDVSGPPHSIQNTSV